MSDSMERKVELLPPEMAPETGVEGESAPIVAVAETTPAVETARRDVSVPVPQETAQRTVSTEAPADPLYVEVQKAMAGGLDAHISKLPAESVAALDASGDALAARVRATIGTKAFHIGKVAGLVEKWLMVPGMGEAYAIQHTKKVADRLAAIHEHQGSSLTM